MSFVEDLLTALKNEPNKQLILPDALSFPSIDLDKLEVEIGLEDQARANGVAESPRSDSKELGYVEQKIVEFTIRTIRPFQASYTEAIAAYSARLATLDPLGFDAKIRGLAAKKKAEIKMIATQAGGEIYLQENYLREREREYQKIKEKHADQADPSMRFPVWVKYLIIVALVILEGTLNSFFLGDYMRGGLIEGLAYALAIPLISVVFLGSLAGVSLRKLIYANHIERVMYAFFVLVAVIGSLAVTLVLAALRIAVDISEDYQNLAFDIWLSLVKLQPEHPMNTSGMLLVALGFGFFVVAMLDIKSLDHPIPGFLAAFESRERAHQQYMRKMEELNKRLANSADASAEFSNAFDRLQAWQTEYQHIIINRRQMASKFNVYIRHIESQVNNLLSKYRQINVQHRKTSAPMHFATKWVYPDVIVEPSESELQIKEFQEKLQRVYVNIELIQKEIEDEVKKLAGVIISVKTAISKS